MKPILAFTTLALAAGAAPSIADVPVFTGGSTIAGEEYLLANWHFNDGGADDREALLAVSRGAGAITHTFTENNVVSFAGTADNAYDGDPAGGSLSLQVGSDLVNNDASVTFALSMASFRDLVLTYATRGTGTGFDSQTWQYSLDGESFSDLETETGTTDTSYRVRTVHFTSVDALDGASEVFIRAVFDGGSGATGNNRLDNVQFRATALEGDIADGAGTAEFSNITSGSLSGRTILEPGVEQSLRFAFQGLGEDELTSVAVTLPEGFSGLNDAGVTLSGAGFSGAEATVSGSSLTVTGASLTRWNHGQIDLDGIVTPSETTGLGGVAFLVESAVADGELSPIEESPTGQLIVPIERIRSVDDEGVPLTIDEKVAVSGVGTVDALVLSPSRLAVYLQDETGGVALEHSDIGEFISGFFEGNGYIVQGTVKQSNGLTQLSVPDEEHLINLGIDGTPEPQTLSISDLLGDPEAFEGTLVRIAGARKDSGDWPQVHISDDFGANRLTLFVNEHTDLADASEPDYPIDIIGIFAQNDSSAPFNESYRIMPRGQRDLTAAEESSGYATWVEVAFDEEQRAEPSVSGALADPDGDQLPNVLEYAFDGDPLAATEPAPEIRGAGEFLEITFPRRDASDLIYRVEASANLSEWTGIWNSDEDPGGAPETGTVFHTVSDTEPVGGDRSRFLRLRVELR